METRPRSLRDRIGTRPLYWVFAYYAVGFAALSFLLDAILGGGVGSRWKIFAGLLFAAAMTPYDWWARRGEKPPAPSD